MARYSSSSATGAGSMRAVLMLMLLLGAVVAAHGRKVSCENKCPKEIKVNGVPIKPNAVALIEVAVTVKVEVVGGPKYCVSAPYYCPPDVSALVVVYVDGLVTLKVKAVVKLIIKPIATLLGLVLGFFPCKF